MPQPGPSRPRGRSNTSSSRRTVPAAAAASVNTPQADIVAATFANADLVATRAALNTYYHKNLELDEENRTLRMELEQHDVDSLKVTSHLEQQLDAAQVRYSLYKSEATAIIQRLSESEAGLRSHYETLLAERDRQLSAYADAAARLQSDLLQASRYVQQRQAHTMELKQLQEQLEEMAEKHEKELVALRFETIDRKMRLVALERTMKEEFESLVDAESARLLEAREAALLQHSKSLEQEKHDMAHDIEELMALTSLIDGERTVMRRTADIHQQTHKEVLRQVAVRNRQGREQELKSQRLEAKVRELTAKQHHVAQDTAAPYVARVAELETQLTAAQNALAQHRQELRQMRKLTRRVVLQRTELERFFHTALDDCKRYRAGLENTIATANGTANMTSGAFAATTASGRAAATMPARTAATAAVMRAAHTQSTSATATAGSRSRGVGTFHLTQPLFADGTRRLRVGAEGNQGSVEAPASAGVALVSSLPPVRGTSPPPPPAPAAAATLTGTMTAPVPAACSASALPSDGAHFEELPWCDKEKVIKSLFFFINSTYYATQEFSDDDEEAETSEAEGAGKPYKVSQANPLLATSAQRPLAQA